MHSIANYFESKILIVDDNSANVLLVQRMLEYAGYTNLRTTYDPTSVLGIFREWEPDLLILDLHMPKMTGYQVMAELQANREPDQYVPILVFTADVTPEAKKMALEAGASDFLTKPGEANEILLRVRNFLSMRQLYGQLASHNKALECRVKERTIELEKAQVEIIERLARAAEYRDDDTGEHTKRVGLLAAKIARELGLPESEVGVIELAAALHDLGKIGTPDGILLKKGKLEPEEFEIIKQHTVIGANVLAGSSSPLLQAAEQIALYHHEKWDGSGYPHGLAGEAIPLYGRICAVADVYDALRSDRPYKKAMPHAEAVQIIREGSGKHFDPRVVEAFLSLVEAEDTSELLKAA